MKFDQTAPPADINQIFAEYVARRLCAEEVAEKTDQRVVAAMEEITFLQSPSY